MSSEDIILKLDLYDCRDPTLLYQQARHHNLNFSHWFRKPNSFFLPRGRGPGIGWVLLQKSDADDLDLDVQHKLIIGAIPNEGSPTSFQVVIYELYVTDVITLYTDDMLSPSDESVRLIKLEDVRHVLFQTVLNKSYNIRDSTTGQYLSSTLNNPDPYTDPYTWQEILEDIWDEYFKTITGEDCPILPSVPGYSPEGFAFHNISAWEAWNQVVEASGCVVVYDPTQIAVPRFSITSLKGLRTITWPEARRGRASTVPEHGPTCYPATISVFFPGVGASAPDKIAYRKDVASGIPGASPDVTHSLWFPHYAIYSIVTDPDNKTELDILAAGVAEKYSDQFIVPGGAVYTAYDFKRLYFGTFLTIIPDRLVDSVHWRDFGDQSGLSTEYRGGLINSVWAPVLPAAPSPSMEIIRFSILELECDLCRAKAQVLSRPGTGAVWGEATESVYVEGQFFTPPLEYGMWMDLQVVTVYDLAGCHLKKPENDLLYKIGYASLLTGQRHEDCESDYEGYGDDIQRRWEIMSICCDEFRCASESS